MVEAIVTTFLLMSYEWLFLLPVDGGKRFHFAAPWFHVWGSKSTSLSGPGIREKMNIITMAILMEYTGSMEKQAYGVCKLRCFSV